MVHKVCTTNDVIFLRYAYARVSTPKQYRDGNSLEYQIEKLQATGYDGLVIEQFIGSTVKRSCLDELVFKLKFGDTLIVTKMDRLLRNMADGTTLIRDLLNRGVAVRIFNMGLIDNTPTGKLIIHILPAFSEYDRDMII